MKILSQSIFETSKITGEIDDQKPQYQSVNFQFSQIEQFGGEFIQFLKLRKKVFVDGLGWNLANFDSLELDQFDNPTAYYLVITDIDGRVVAGTRFAPITNQYGALGSMSFEVSSGNLGAIPKDILSNQYLISDNWEATRLVIHPELVLRERKKCLSLLIVELIKAVNNHGGRAIVTLSPTSLKRLVMTNKINVSQISESYTCKEDLRKYASFLISVD